MLREREESRLFAAFFMCLLTEPFQPHLTWGHRLFQPQPSRLRGSPEAAPEPEQMADAASVSTYCQHWLPVAGAFQPQFSWSSRLLLPSPWSCTVVKAISLSINCSGIFCKYFPHVPVLKTFFFRFKHLKTSLPLIWSFKKIFECMEESLRFEAASLCSPELLMPEYPTTGPAWGGHPSCPLFPPVRTHEVRRHRSRGRR